MFIPGIDSSFMLESMLENILNLQIKMVSINRETQLTSTIEDPSFDDLHSNNSNKAGGMQTQNIKLTSSIFEIIGP